MKLVKNKKQDAIRKKAGNQKKNKNYGQWGKKQNKMIEINLTI